MIHRAALNLVQQADLSFETILVKLLNLSGSNFGMLVTWLILPVVICLSQRLSHACLSINNYTVKLRMAH